MILKHADISQDFPKQKKILSLKYAVLCMKEEKALSTKKPFVWALVATHSEMA